MRCDWKRRRLVNLWWVSYYKLVLTILTTIILIGVQTMESVLDHCLAWFSSKYVLKEEQPHVFWEKFNLAVVRGSETQTKKKERGIVVASPLPSIINDQVEAMREAAISAVALPCRGTRGAADMLFFKNRKLSSSSLLSWNLALIKENPARVLLTWLLQGEQTLPDWSSACEIAKPRSLKSSANFRFVKNLDEHSQKKDSLAVALREWKVCPELLTYTKHPHILQ